MKKYLILILLFLATAGLHSQTSEPSMPVSDVTGLITYQEVVDQTGTKDDLFNRCSQWLHTFYANPWEATKIRDQATGLIKIQHQFRIYDTDEAGNQKEAGTILYTCKIEFKENRYRYTIDNFMLKQVSRYPVETWMDKSRGDYSEKWIDYLAQINQYITEELIRSLKEKMQPEEAVKEAEW